MKKELMEKVITISVLALIVIAAAITAEASTTLGDYLAEKEIEIEVSASIDFYDKYVWRGMLLDKDNVLQPAVTLSGYGFEGGFWGSWDLQSHDGLSSDEVDGWIGYNFDLGFIDERLGIVGLSVGHTWYSFPETDGYSKEWYVSASLDTFLSPYINYYIDYEDESQGGADGQYLMVGIGHSINLSEEYGITLDLGQELGYNKKAFIEGEGGYSLTTVGFTIPLTETLTMMPNMGYSIPLDDLADESDGNYGEQFYGGVSLAFSF